MDACGRKNTPLAVVGMACRLPGAGGLAEYWDLIRRGGCALGPLPRERLDLDLYYDPRKGVLGKSYSLLGGIVPERPLNGDVCPLPPDVLEGADPVHITMLEVAGEALHHAGWDPRDVPYRNAGVFVGNARGSLRSANAACAIHAREVASLLTGGEAFRTLRTLRQEQLLLDMAARLRATSGSPERRVDMETHRVAALVAEAFGLTGPAMAVDAACASSLMALSQAARALGQGRIEMAVVGGASFSGWTSLVLFSQAQALSAAGSFPFDARADGFVSADGYAAVIVKTLPRALADGDRIVGVVRGIGLSSDGRGKSLWAPRKEGQMLAIRRGLACGVDATRIGYVEAHGTSTQLGDACEIEALAEELGPYLPPSRPVPVASVKGNIGHTRETAGLAGLIKTLLAMQHAEVPPAAGFEVPNPEIPWTSIPFYVPTAVENWLRPRGGGPRRAAIDAFGIGGLNVHLLVDDEPECRTGGAQILVHDNVPKATIDVGPVADQAPVAVIGRGAVFPGARTLAAFHELLRDGRSAIVSIPSERWEARLFPASVERRVGSCAEPRAGCITDFEYDWRKHRIPPRQLAHADPLQFMVLDAAEQALQEAGWLDRDFDREATAVVIGTAFGGDFSIQLALALRLPEFQKALRACFATQGLVDLEIDRVCNEFATAFRARYTALMDETASYSSSTLASRVSKTLDLMGGAFAIDAGGGSSLAALTAAIDLLRAGACRAVLCAGAQRGLDPCFFDAYRVQGVLASDSPRSRFDAAADGLVPGEGCGLVLLKRLEDALRDGDAIHGVIRGIGEAISTQDRPAAVTTAVARALVNGHVGAPRVSAVESAGPAIPQVDAVEAAGLRAGYESDSRQCPVWIDSIAERIGYAHAAAGMASLLKLLAELDEGRLYGAARRTQPIAAVTDAARTLRLADRPVPLPADRGTPLLGAVSVVTLNGCAQHLLVECPTPHRAALTPGAPERLFRFEAADVEELALALNRAGSNGNREATVFSRTSGARLVVVAADRTAVDAKLAVARNGLTSVNARPVLEKQGVFVSERPRVPPRIAFVFTGQGSQYAGMLRALVDESPLAAGELAVIDATLGELGFPTFKQLAWDETEKLGRELFETQLSVLLADVLMFRVLAAMGIRPDVITAHSFGEYAALVASDAWGLQQAIHTTRARCRAITESGVCGGMLATTASMDDTERLLAEAGVAGEAFVANANSPEQTVVAGRNSALRTFAECLQSRGCQTRVLPVPAPYHTPLMDPVRVSLRPVIEGVTLRPPAIPFLSSVTNRYTADPIEVRDNLVEQLVRPVRYVELVRRLIADGIDVIIEVGPRDVLTKLHRAIAGAGPVGVIATDDPRHPGTGQLLYVQALLECRGAFRIGSEQAQRLVANSNGCGPQPARAARRGPIIHFDATAKRRERHRRAGHAPESEPPPGDGRRRNSASAHAAPDDELAGFLVRFVCEQTGYPPEVVDLDAELEADLGIDSIKKAQLLGELREHFPLRTAAHLALDDFPTLRHILEFIRASQAEAGGGSGAPPHGGPTAVPANAAATSILQRTPPPSDATRGSRVVAPPLATAGDAATALNLRRFSGTPYDLGRQHGEAEADAIRNVMQKYVELLGGRLFEMRPLQSALDQRHAYFGADGLEELRGIAEAVGVPLEYVLAFNYGLSMEFLPGCTQFAVTARWNGNEGLIHAVNEDWMLALALPGTLKRMAQVRFPAGGIPFLTFSTCGELAGQNGINARGLAVSSTLLLDRLRRDQVNPGRVHPALVKSVLERAATIDEALAIIRELPRTGAWSLCLSQSDAERLCYVEYDADSVAARRSDDVVESTNHCLLQSAIGETPAQSCQRLDRLHELLHGENGSASRVTLAQAQSILRDRYDRSLGRVTAHPTKATIRRPYTQASIVMRPAPGEVWVSAETRPDQAPDRFHRLDLRELFREAPESSGTDVAPAAPAADSDPMDCRAIPGRIMNRFVLRMMDAPLPDSTAGSEPLTGRVLLLGDNQTAHALRRLLEESGAEVLALPVTDVTSAVERLEQFWAEGPAAALLLVTARDADAACGVDEVAWRERRERGVLLPYLVCQKWVQLATRRGPTATLRLIAVTGMGGDFGLSGRSAAVEGGALAGLLKAVQHEFDQVTAKVIDAPLEDPPQLVARCVLEELAAGSPNVETAYVCGRRRVLAPVPRIATTPAAGTGLPDAPVPRGTWVITGGGRGVTALVARELGRRYGLKLHLIGSSLLPEVPAAWRDLSTAGRHDLRAQIMQEARASGRDPAADWRDVERGLELDANLRAFAADGMFVNYHACNVADRGKLAAVLDSIRASDGPIHGVIHGAGFEAASRFDRKTVSSVSATLAVKVDGAVHLAELTRDDPLEFFVGFGSISGRFGGHGQTDYSMSSDLLAKLLCRLRRERPGCLALTVHWPVWGEVGMAMRPESKLALEIAGHRFMPPAEGAAHLVDELDAGAPEREILLYDWPAPRGPRRASPWTAAGAQTYWRRACSIAAAPLIEGLVHVEEGRRLIAELRLDPVRDAFLAQHRREATPILPIVIALEALVEGVQLLLPDSRTTALCDVSIHDGMRFQTPDAGHARVDVLVEDDGRLRCELRSDFRNRRGAVADPSRLYVSAIAATGRDAPMSAVPWAEPPSPWRGMAYDSEEAKEVQRMIWHGPVFQCLREFCVADERLWGRIVAPPPRELRPTADEAGWHLPAAVLDACLQACSTLTYVSGGKYHLPHTLGRLHLGRAPTTGEPCIVLVRFREERDERTHFDFTLYGEDRRVILDVVDYRAAIISGRRGTP